MSSQSNDPNLPQGQGLTPQAATDPYRNLEVPGDAPPDAEGTSTPGTTHTDFTTDASGVTTDTSTTDTSTTGTSGGSSLGDSAQETADRAKETAKDAAASVAGPASDVKEAATTAGKDVLETAKAEGAQVVGEAKAQGRRLLDESVSELRGQASAVQSRLADTVEALTDELRAMAGAPDANGPVANLASTGQDLGDRAAAWLRDNDLDQALAGIRRYAARNPWTFLAIAGGAGLLVGRLARGLKDADSGPQGASSSGSYGQGTYGRRSYTTGGYATGSYSGADYGEGIAGQGAAGQGYDPYLQTDAEVAASQDPYSGPPETRYPGPSDESLGREQRRGDL